MRETFTQVTYLVASVLFILGLRSLTKPDTARRGMQYAALGMLLAIVGTLVQHEIVRYDWIIGGLILGTIIGIPKNGKHEKEAWDLVKYLATNNHALAQFSNGIRNVPSTLASLKSKELTPDTHFSTFLKIFGNAHSATSPITASGVSYTNLVASFMTKWQAGKVKDLHAGLTTLDKQLDAQVAQAKGGGVP